MKDLKIQLLDGRATPREFLRAQPEQPWAVPWWAGRGLSKAWNAKRWPQERCVGWFAAQPWRGVWITRVGIHGVVLCPLVIPVCPFNPGNSEPMDCWELPCGGHPVQPGEPNALIIHPWPCSSCRKSSLLSKERNLYTFSSHKRVILNDQNKMAEVMCYVGLEEAGFSCDKPKARGALLARLCLPGWEVGDLIYRKTQGWDYLGLIHPLGFETAAKAIKPVTIAFVLMHR